MGPQSVPDLPALTTAEGRLQAPPALGIPEAAPAALNPPGQAQGAGERSTQITSLHEAVGP